MIPFKNEYIKCLGKCYVVFRIVYLNQHIAKYKNDYSDDYSLKENSLFAFTIELLMLYVNF